MEGTRGSAMTGRSGEVSEAEQPKRKATLTPSGWRALVQLDRGHLLEEKPATAHGITDCSSYRGQC